MDDARRIRSELCAKGVRNVAKLPFPQTCGILDPEQGEPVFDPVRNEKWFQALVQ